MSDEFERDEDKGDIAKQVQFAETEVPEGYGNAGNRADGHPR